VITDSSQKSRKSPKAHAVKNAWYSDQQKLEAVQTYLMVGSLAEVGRLLHINEHTLRMWKQSDWWHQVTEDMKKQDQILLTKRLKGIAGKSLELMEERLNKGDWIYDQKTGELRRKPVSLRDATQASVAVLTLQDKIDNKENYVVAQEQIEQKLAKLAEAFTKLSRGERLEPPEDIEYVEEVKP